MIRSKPFAGIQAGLDQNEAVFQDQIAAIIAERGPLWDFIGLVMRQDYPGIDTWRWQHGEKRWLQAMELMLSGAREAFCRACADFATRPEEECHGR